MIWFEAYEADDQNGWLADALKELQPQSLTATGMRHLSVLIMLFGLSACGSGSATFDEMTKTRWANKPENCNTQFTTFDHKLIRQHYPDGALDFGKIVQIAEDLPSRVMLTVEPSSAIISAAKNRPGARLPHSVTMGFEMKGEHLRLPVMVGGDHGEIGGVLNSSSMEYRLFDLVRCGG